MAKLTKKQLEHRKFIASKEWASIKGNLFRIRGKECEICGSKKTQVHHKHYNKPYGEEQPEDLIILCGKHHRKAHGLIKESEKEKETRELHEEMWNVPGCYRMEHEKPRYYRPKKKPKKKKRKLDVSKMDLETIEFKRKTVLRKKRIFRPESQYISK